MKLNQLLILLVFTIIGYGVFDLFNSGSRSIDTDNPDDGYVDATGRAVSLMDFAGEYLWIDYAADWCSYCGPQTVILKNLERERGDEVRFLTVVAGTHKVMEPPTADTAMTWARRYALDPQHVLARFSTNTLPYHILYSPTGEILFQGSGLLEAQKIRHILNAHVSP